MDPTVPPSSDVLLLKSFLRSLKVEGSAPRTFMAYVGDVGRFQKHLAGSDIMTDLQAATTAEISGYLQHLARQRSSAGTIKRVFMSLRTFYAHLVEIEAIATDPTEDLAIGDSSVETLTAEAILRILKYYDAKITARSVYDLVDEESRRTERDRFIFLLVLLCGVRQYQIPNLRLSMISTRNDLIVFDIPSASVVPVSAPLVPFLHSYLSRRTSNGDLLFVDEPVHSQLRQSTIRTIMTELSLVCGMKCSPWILYNTFERLQRHDSDRRTVFSQLANDSRRFCQSPEEGAHETTEKTR